MSKVWVCNASPIILLSKAESLFLLTELADKVIIPNGVKQELSKKIDNRIQDVLSHKKVKMVKLRKVNPKVLEWGLGKGESEVISLALENSAYEVMLDDRLGRKCAISLSIKVRGTVGIIILAKRKGLLSEARPVIQRLIDSGIYFSDEWLSNVLSMVGEKWT